MALRAAEQFGPYLVYEQLGMGGMATVHRAETTGLAGFRRPVALKRMLPHVASNEDLVRSFVREARLASHLHHANVAQTYELGKVDDIYFIAMELVLGRTLRDILRLCAKTSTRIPIPLSLNILTQVCDALDYAHNLSDESGQPLGIVHRDVSPSNVIVAEGGVVKLIDFGIAKASAAGMQTMSGTIKGKFGYMAPEYLAGKIDSRADLFAVGIIAHELLTGRPLFQGHDDMDTLYRVKSMAIESPRTFNPAVPVEIDSIVMTALERDPDARWQRAAAMRVALTTEMKRLGMTVLDYQVAQWTEGLFQDALGDVSTPAPTRVLGTSPSIMAQQPESVIIERVAEHHEPPRRAERQSDPPQHRTLLGSLAPRTSVTALPLAAPPPSGERTKLVLAPVSAAVSGELAPQLEPELSAVGLPATRRMGNLTIALLLLLTAAAAGAVVYFGLPYVQ